jgi:hypothetical protein
MTRFCCDGRRKLFAGLRMRDDLNILAAAFGFALGTFIGATRFSSCRAT